MHIIRDWRAICPRRAHHVVSAHWRRPTSAVLRRAVDGTVLATLAAADPQPLIALGWRWPEPFVATVDGVALHAVLWRPVGLDDDAAAARSVPVIENIYTGPHSAHVPKRYSAAACGMAAATAALGFAVCFIDGRGTGLRSRSFREVSHKNLGDGAGGGYSHCRRAVIVPAPRSHVCDCSAQEIRKFANSQIDRWCRR